MKYRYLCEFSFYFFFISFFSLILIFLILSNNHREVRNVSEHSLKDDDEDNDANISSEHQNVNNDLNLLSLSKFEDERYRCTGSCYCEEEKMIIDKREVLSNIFSSRKQLFYLVSATTSILAYKKASKHFQQECEMKFSDTCTPTKKTSIKTEIESCERTSSSTQIINNDFDVRRFVCSGKCLVKIFSNRKIQRIASVYQCRRLSLNDGHVQVDCSHLLKTTTTTTEKMKNKKCKDLAIKKFNSMYIHPYCIKNSEGRRKEGSGRYISDWVEVHFCVGRYKGKINPTIKCRQIYPEYLWKPAEEEEEEEN